MELPPRGLMSPSDFWRANWFPVVRRVELRTFTTVSKYSKGVAPFYLSDKFMPSLYNYNAKLQIKYKKVSFLGPKIWIKICSNVKAAASTASFREVLKKGILEKLKDCAILLFF